MTIVGLVLISRTNSRSSSAVEVARRNEIEMKCDAALAMTEFVDLT